MKDTLDKLRNMLDINKTVAKSLAADLGLAQDTVAALRDDLAHAVRIIQTRDREIIRLKDELVEAQQAWWLQLDSDEAWFHDYLARQDERILAKHVVKTIPDDITDDELLS
jgi:hypothetical protein